MYKCLAIITARGGSKRIPRKNIKSFLEHPIIKYPIEAALQSKCFDEVMVSTDDKEIANISKKYGASIPFYRSKKTSDDFATTRDVLLEVLNRYKNSGKTFTYVCCIYPTASFVTPHKIKAGLSLLKKLNADKIIPVTKFSNPIQRAFKIENNMLKMVWPENFPKRSQDLTPTYHDCGQFYWMKSDYILNNNNPLTGKIIPFIIPESEAQDIDNEEDLKLAELKYKLLYQIKE